jgi:phosphoglycolate phosphatase
VPELDHIPRFAGGLVGYFGYDCIQYIEQRLAKNTKNDVNAARAARFQILCVSYGYNLGEDIRDSKPDAVVDSLEEISKFL